jgi:hypothetical protein
MAGPKFASLAACVLFAAVAALPSDPFGSSRPSGCAFEVRVESDHSGLVQIYYDLGGGLSERDSALQPILAGQPKVLRLPLPAGTLRALRFDPLDRGARMSFSGARIVDRRGGTLAAFAPGQFLASFQIDTARVADGKVTIETSPGGNDPQMVLRLGGPVVIPARPWWHRSALVLAILVAALLAWEGAARSARVRAGDRLRSLWARAASSPAKTILGVALLATVVANFPVVFAGKSLTSPHLGVALLYGQNPWVPGYQSAEVGDPHASDVAALLWHHLPLSMIERRALLRDRELPLWNRYDSGGVPLLGQGQSCFGDPLQFLPILANGAAWSWDLKFILAKWLWAAGLGLCAWWAFRHLPSALLLAASASFLGFFVYRISHPAIFSLCYSPWILLCWLRLLESRGARAAILWLVALIGANWVEMNSGTGKEAYILLLSMNFTGFCLFLTAERPWAEMARLLAGLGAAGLTFALLGSPVWLTFYHALKGSYTSYNAPLAFQLQPGMLLGLFDEAFYRPFQLDLGVVNPSANIFILVGVLWALVRWRALASSRLALGLFLSGLPALALVYGLVPPAAIARVPFLGNILHVDNTFSCALIVIFAVLAAFGWREAWERLGTPEGAREGRMVVALLILIFAAYLGTAQAIVRSAYYDRTWGKIITVPPFLHAYGGSLVLAAAAFLWVLHRGRRQGAASAALVVCGALALGVLHWREALQLGGGFPEYVVRPTDRVDLQAGSPTIDSIRAARAEPFRVLGFHNDLLPGWSIAYDLEGISGPDALVNPYYREFMDGAGVSRVWDWRYIVEAADLPRLKPILDLLNVRFYVAFHEGGRPAGKFLKFVQSSDMDSFESGSAWPRAFFTDSAAVYDDLPQLCSWIRAGDGRPFAAIQRGDWVRLSPVPTVSGDLGTRRISAAQNYRLTVDSTAFTVAASGPGFIVLTEDYERDNFRATVDGQEVPYLRVNHAFKGVYVGTAGTHEVRFTYWPKGFTGTLVLFGLGLAVIAGALAVALFVLQPARRGPDRP